MNAITDAMIKMFPAEKAVQVYRNESVLVARIPRTLYRMTGRMAQEQINGYTLNVRLYYFKGKNMALLEIFTNDCC